MVGKHNSSCIGRGYWTTNQPKGFSVWWGTRRAWTLQVNKWLRSWCRLQGSGFYNHETCSEDQGLFRKRWGPLEWGKGWPACDVSFKLGMMGREWMTNNQPRKWWAVATSKVCGMMWTGEMSQSTKQGRRGPTPRVSTQRSECLQDSSNTSSGKPMWLDASLKCLYTNTCGMGRTQEEFHAWKDPMQYGPREKRSPGEQNDFQESPPPS